MLALVLAAGHPARRQALLYAAAAVVTIAAGSASIYQAANWLTDVLAGWALGALCITLVLSADLLTTAPGNRSAAASKTRPFRTARRKDRRNQAA